MDQRGRSAGCSVDASPELTARPTVANTVVAFFTVLFTKEIPRGVFELIVPGLRWNLRGNAYAYS